MAIRLTVADRILLAALDLGGANRESFTAEELVVAAWRHFPEAFGLRGILDDGGVPLHPDSNRVFAEIMGSKPLRKNGLLEKVGDKRYQLTEAGLQRSSALSGQTYEARSRRSLGRPLQDGLRRLVTSRAAEKSRSARSDDLTFHDACGFWGITPRSSANALAARLAETESILAAAKSYAGGGSVDLGKRKQVDADEIGRLVRLNTLLQDRYSTELSAIRQRTDERRS